MQRKARGRGRDLGDQLGDDMNMNLNTDPDADGDNDNENARTKRRRLKTDKDAIAKQTQKEKEELPGLLRQRDRALKALENSTDLPSAYAALKVAKEVFRINSSTVDDDPTLKLIEKASLAVPFLMYKISVERFTRPRSFGGLAFSIAKAKRVAAVLFQNIGPACCSAGMTEKELVKLGRVEAADARKVLPKLKDVGIEARAEVENIRKLVIDDVDHALMS